MQYVRLKTENKNATNVSTAFLRSDCLHEQEDTRVKADLDPLLLIIICSLFKL